MRIPTEERFLSKVDSSDPLGCWWWRARRNALGYGTFKVNNKSVLAHRFMYEMAIGDIAPGALICHHCDNPGCVFPFHLYQGTNHTNTRDKVNRGRSCAGERSHWHKLTAEQATEIRHRYAAGGISQKELASEYGVRACNVSQILSGKIWVDHSKEKPVVLRSNLLYQGSGYKGVSERHGKWRARVSTKMIGSFDTPEEAAEAYDREAYQRWGDRAYLNFPERLVISDADEETATW